ncbi:MAG: transposase family protein [Verrucomicrobia bacterium]|nr:transposase family protein [Leptolyngbya sp. ES-bin-22]
MELPNGLPTHDTFVRVFDRLRPEQVQQCFLNWVQAVFVVSGGQLITNNRNAVPRNHFDFTHHKTYRSLRTFSIEQLSSSFEALLVNTLTTGCFLIWKNILGIVNLKIEPVCW